MPKHQQAPCGNVSTLGNAPSPNAPRFDYTLQVWTYGGVVQRCGHPEAMRCGCPGYRYQGLQLRDAYMASGRTPPTNTKELQS